LSVDGGMLYVVAGVVGVKYCCVWPRRLRVLRPFPPRLLVSRPPCWYRWYGIVGIGVTCCCPGGRAGTLCGKGGTNAGGVALAKFAKDCWVDWSSARRDAVSA